MQHIAPHLNASNLVGLTVWKCTEGYQANLQTEPGGGWRVSIDETPAAAVLGLFVRPVPPIAPPPY